MMFKAMMATTKITMGKIAVIEKSFQCARHYHLTGNLQALTELIACVKKSSRSSVTLAPQPLVKRPGGDFTDTSHNIPNLPFIHLPFCSPPAMPPKESWEGIRGDF